MSEMEINVRVIKCPIVNWEDGYRNSLPQVRCIIGMVRSPKQRLQLLEGSGS